MRRLIVEEQFREVTKKKPSQQESRIAQETSWVETAFKFKSPGEESRSCSRRVG